MPNFKILNLNIAHQAAAQNQLITTFGRRTVCLRYNQGRNCPNLQPGGYCNKPGDTKKHWHICAKEVSTSSYPL